MLITDGAPSTYKEIFDLYNKDKKVSFHTGQMEYNPLGAGVLVPDRGGGHRLRTSQADRLRQSRLHGSRPEHGRRRGEGPTLHPDDVPVHRRSRRRHRTGRRPLERCLPGTTRMISLIVFAYPSFAVPAPTGDIWRADSDNQPVVRRDEQDGLEEGESAGRYPPPC